MTRIQKYVAVALLATCTTAITPISAAISGQKPAAENSAMPVTHYRTVKVDGIDIFYREAGPADAPVVLLLHGFPASSFQFRDLIPRLADRYRVIAPDLPGFGFTQVPD